MTEEKETVAKAPAKKVEAKKTYKVIKDFTDLTDNQKVYTVNDPFPKPANKKVSADRIKQLLKHSNGKSYIEEV